MKNLQKESMAEHADTNKVSYRIVERRKVSELLDAMQGKAFSEKELHKVVRDMANLGSEVLPVCIAKLKTAPVDMLGLLCMIIEMLGDDDVIPGLVKLLRDGQLPDMNKTAILSVLCYFGYDPSDLPLEQMFDNLSSVANDSMDLLLEDVAKEQDILPLILEEFSGFPADFQTSLIEELAVRNDRRAVPLLLLFAKSRNPKLANHAIRSLSVLACEESAAALNELTHSSIVEVQPLANRELIRLRMQGIASKSSYSRRKKPGELYKVLISSVDSQGNRGIWFAWRVPGTKTLLNSFNLLININQGLKDCWGTSKVKIKDFQQMEDEVKGEFWILEDQIEYAYEILRDALNTHYSSGELVPIEFAYWQRFLDEQQLTPKALEIVISPNLPKISMNTIKDTLFDLSVFREWALFDERIFGFTEELVEIKNHTRTEVAYQRKWSLLLKNFCQQVLLDHLEQIKKKLQYNLDFCAKFTSEEYKVLTAAFKEIIDSLDTIPHWQNPFIEKVLLNSINYVIENAHSGIDYDEELD